MVRRPLQITLVNSLLVTLLLPACGHGQTLSGPDLAAATKARDHGNVQALQELIATTRVQARQAGSAASYRQVALLNLWLYEAASQKSDHVLMKSVVEAGVSAAEMAVALDPQASEGHRLLGDLLGRKIPETFAGGLRYGARASREVRKAIELDPGNPEAYIARGVAALFTPRAFGGNLESAIADFQKALALDPSSDSAHLWLAQALNRQGNKDEALKQINAALALDPDRGFSRWIYGQISAEVQE